jgi:hypothetical protein
MELNIITFIYLFLRLAPFILVCFFSLSSLFNNDFKGIIYLLGLLVSCFITIMVGNTLNLDGGTPMTAASVAPDVATTENTKYTPDPMCSIMTIGMVENIAHLPMSQSVLGFTFAYILYAIITNSLVTRNIPTLVFFPVLITFDFIWNAKNSCYTILQLLVALIIGSLFGVIWGLLINSQNDSMMVYYSGISSTEVCNKPSQSTFKCNVYKNGMLLGQTS